MEYLWHALLYLGIMHLLFKMLFMSPKQTTAGQAHTVDDGQAAPVPHGVASRRKRCQRLV